MKKSYEWIVFDLGGVLVELAGFSFFDKWIDNKADKPDLAGLWLKSPSVRLYEAGKITSMDYAQRFVREMKLNCTAEEFHKSYKSFIKGPFEGAFDMLRELKAKTKLALLSNTNDIHWEGVTHDYPLESYFDRVFLSYKLGMMKPDREIFDHLIKELDVPASKILYFDDNQANIEAARKTGIEAYAVGGPKDIKHKLRDLKIV